MKRLMVLLLAGIMAAAALAACNTNTGSTGDTAQATAVQTQNADGAAKQTSETSSDSSQKATQAQEITATANVTSNGAVDASDMFTDRDLRQNADLSEATYYEVSDNKDITITSAGVYVISGSASNASVIVDAGDDDKVQLVLNGLTLNNSGTPAIYVKNADKVFVTTASGTVNELTVSGSFTSDGDTNTDAVIFSKDDLVLNGLGTLNIRNIVLCASVCLKLGLTGDQIRRGIEKVKPVEHRLQLLDTSGRYTVIDDAFNSNIVGAEQAFQTLKEFPGRRIVVTPGMVELGSREEEMNVTFGGLMDGCCDLAILVGKKRSEAIRKGLEDAGFDSGRILVLNSLAEAGQWIAENAREGDTILFENDLPDNYNE